MKTIFDSTEKVDHYNLISNYLNKLKNDKNLDNLEQIKGINIYKDKIPDKCGVYILTYKDSEKYIGSSTNLRKRLNQHKNKRNDIINVDMYISDSELHSHILEYLLIIRLKPKWNGSTLGNMTEEEFIELYNMQNSKIKQQFDTESEFYKKLVT